MTYVFILKNEKDKSYRSISVILLVINFASILFLTYLNEFTKPGPFILSLPAALSIFVSYYFKNKNEKIFFAAAFFLFSISWITAGFWLPAMLNLFFSVYNLIALKKPMVEIDENKIMYPSIFTQKAGWEDLNNVILKDGLLTIDFKNNRLFQQPILNPGENVNEEEFNAFCRQQLKK